MDFLFQLNDSFEYSKLDFSFPFLSSAHFNRHTVQTIDVILDFLVARLKRKTGDVYLNSIFYILFLYS